MERAEAYEIAVSHGQEYFSQSSLQSNPPPPVVRCVMTLAAANAPSQVQDFQTRGRCGAVTRKRNNSFQEIEKEKAKAHKEEHNEEMYRKKTYVLPALGELDSEAARRRGLPDSALPPDEHPLQRLLVEDVFEAGFRQIGVVEIVVSGHDFLFVCFACL